MSDVVVVDANLALKWVLIEPDSIRSMMLLDKWTNEEKGIIAPALFSYEVTNILYRQVVMNKLTYDEASRGLTKLFATDHPINLYKYFISTPNFCSSSKNCG